MGSYSIEETPNLKTYKWCGRDIWIHNETKANDVIQEVENVNSNGSWTEDMWTEETCAGNENNTVALVEYTWTEETCAEDACTEDTWNEDTCTEDTWTDIAWNAWIQKQLLTRRDNDWPPLWVPSSREDFLSMVI
jgi:hypothetical protein